MTLERAKRQEIYDQVDLKVGEKVKMYWEIEKGGLSKDDNWVDAVVVGRYPTYTLFDTGKYKTGILNTDILAGQVIKEKLKIKRGQAK